MISTKRIRKKVARELSDGQRKMEGDEEEDKNLYFLQSELNYQNDENINRLNPR